MIDASMVVAGCAIGGNVLLGIGYLVTWQKNGKSHAVDYALVKRAVEDTGDKVDELVTTVNGLDGKMDTFQVRCAETRTSLGERLQTNEREITELRTKRRG